MPSFIAESFWNTTAVPSHPLCQLSFYLKLCSVGCGLDVDIDKQKLGWWTIPMHMFFQSILRNRSSFTWLSMFLTQEHWSDTPYLWMITIGWCLDREEMLLQAEAIARQFPTRSTEPVTISSSRVISRGNALCNATWLHLFYTAPLLATINMTETPILLAAWATPCPEYPVHTVCGAIQRSLQKDLL